MIYGHGGDIYTHKPDLDFSVNVNPLGPPEGVVRAAKQGAERMAAYPDSRCRMLREKLSLKQGIAEDHYIFGNGAADLIYRLALAEKPGRALIPIPAFSEYEQALKTVGCKITYYETKPESCFCIDEHFLKELKAQYDMVFLCSPTNPSGQVIGFLENADERSMLGETEQHPHLFLLRAFTKIYAMPGMRLGYGVSSDRDLLERMEEAGQPWSVSVPAQMAGLAALDEDDYVSEARRLVRVEREFLEAELAGMGIDFISSDANFILIHEGADLFNRLRSGGILIRDCANYPGLGQGWYRIAVRTREENARLLSAIKEIKEGGK